MAQIGLVPTARPVASSEPRRAAVIIRFEPGCLLLYGPGFHRLMGLLHMAGAVLEQSRGDVGRLPPESASSKAESAGGLLRNALQFCQQ